MERRRGEVSLKYCFRSRKELSGFWNADSTRFFLGCFGSMPSKLHKTIAQRRVGNLRETTSNDQFPETNAKMTVSNMFLPDLHSYIHTPPIQTPPVCLNIFLSGFTLSHAHSHAVNHNVMALARSMRAR